MITSTVNDENARLQMYEKNTKVLEEKNLDQGKYMLAGIRLPRQLFY